MNQINLTQVVKQSVAKFGTVGTTIGISNTLDSPTINKFFTKHVCGDWGDLPQEDKDQNMKVLKEENGGRIFSVYEHKGIKFWIITSGYGNDPKDMNMCYTTILLPSEY
tara:strand:- start:252 stop:578 length:327 start_codon:yes stop_codon:yes gene_type:complete